MARTAKQEMVLTEMAVAKIKEKAVAILQATRDANLEAEKTKYQAARQVIDDKYEVDKTALEA